MLQPPEIRHRVLEASDGLEVIEQVSNEFRSVFGRESGGLVRPYRTAGAETPPGGAAPAAGTIDR